LADVGKGVVNVKNKKSGKNAVDLHFNWRCCDFYLFTCFL